MAGDDRLLRHLEENSEWLQQQLGQYNPISGDFVTKFAFEEYPTPTVLGHSIMVSSRLANRATVTDVVGCATSLGRGTRRGGRGADCDPRGPH